MGEDSKLSQITPHFNGWSLLRITSALGWTDGYLKLSEYDFEIEHRPASKHINADVLSRHVAAAVQKDQALGGCIEGGGETGASVPLSKEIIVRAQDKEEFCQQITQALSTGKILPYFLDEDFVLYHGAPEERLQEKLG